MTMTRSTIIPVSLAAFCGLALQFQSNTANAQAYTNINGINLVFFTPQDTFPGGYEICSPIGNCLSVTTYNGQLSYYNLYGDLLWWSNSWGGWDPTDYVVFQNDGNLVIYDPALDYQAVWDTGTTSYWTSTGTQGWYMAIQDDGNFVIYDINWTPLWAASQQATFNWAAQAQAAQACGC
jgi:hypothetical protein